MNRVVIVGSSLAGVHAAEGLRDAGFEGELTLLHGETDLPYDRPPLSKEALFSGVDPSKLELRPRSWYDDLSIDLQTGVRATALDPRSCSVQLGDGRVLGYDGLVIATGSRARCFPPLDEELPIHYLRDLGDAQSLHGRLEHGGHVVIVGAGFIGLEVAATARQMGLEVTVIEVASNPLDRVLGRHAGPWFRELHERHGVRMLCSNTVERIRRQGDRAVLEVTHGPPVEADLVVAGIGAEPETSWLTSSGLRMDNGVLCGDDLRTSLPGVVAAGDVARWYNVTFDEQMRVEHWTNAVEQGRHAAFTLMGARAAYAAVPYFWTDQYDARVRYVGRSVAATETAVMHSDEQRLQVIYGRDGVIVGALCVNSVRELTKYRVAIGDGVPWEDIALDAVSPRGQ